MRRGIGTRCAASTETRVTRAVSCQWLLTRVHLYRVILYTYRPIFVCTGTLCVNQPQCANNESEMASPIAR
jgi:hypothetical protein